MSIALSVNLNKIALIRNSREGNYPDVTAHGKVCLDAGANGLTVHPRPDQRHIRPDDVKALNALVAQYENAEFNIEGNPFAPAMGAYPGLLTLIKQFKPHQCTLVPDSQDQLTSDHGFDLVKDAERLSPIIEQLHRLGVRVSLFMDPDIEQIKLAKAVGADRVELYTGPFAALFQQGSSELNTVFERYKISAECAQSLGLGVNAGHDLNLPNMQLFKQIPALKEVSIGHALTVDAINMGLKKAVESYLDICR